MARAGGIRHWVALRRTLAIPDWSHLKPLAKLTDDTLDRFETKTGFRLPHSYRSFIKVFGPGTLAWSYRIVAPGYPEQSSAVDLGTFNTEIKKRLTDNKRVLRQFNDPAQVLRVVFFCGKDGGDLVGWDPQDIQDRRWQEYGIYELGRGDTLVYVAGSFTEFIENVCLSEANLRISPEQEAELGTRREFLPEYDLSSDRKAVSQRRTSRRT